MLASPQINYRKPKGLNYLPSVGTAVGKPEAKEQCLCFLKMVGLLISVNQEENLSRQASREDSTCNKKKYLN